MKSFKTLFVTSILAGLLALIAAAAGLFWPAGDGQPFLFTSVRGVEVEVNGQGLYAFDTYFKAPVLRGSDAVMLLFGLPLLVIALLWARKGSLRGRLLLVGTLSYLLYNAASLALGVFFNPMVLVYTAFFTSSLYAFILAFRAIDVDELAARVSERFPRRGMIVWTFVAGLTVFVWLPDMIAALLQGAAPVGLAHYTTEITYILDPGVIAPTAFVTCYLLVKRRPMAYLLSAILLTANALVGLMVISQTIFQTAAQIELSVPQLVAFVGSFVVMGTFAVGLLWKYFNSLKE